jgi:Protein of unknown function (DUF4231)
MTEEEYLQDRLQDAINWYSKNSSLNKNSYHFLKTSEIIMAVTIPFLTGYLKENDYIKYAIGILGLLVAIISGLLVLFKYQEKWLEYRTTAESLKHEKFMFITKAGPYKADNSLSNLTERVEILISKENSNWNQFMNSEESKKP